MNELTVIQPQQLAAYEPMSVEQILRHSALIKEVSTKAMQEDVHYGKIPGTAKPTLYQPGAQTLCVTFRLVPEFDPQMKDLGAGHREYLVKTILRNFAGEPRGFGFGSCSTMEDKYRYRNDASDVEIPLNGEGKPHTLPGNFFKIENPVVKLNTLRQLMDDQDGNYGPTKVKQVGDKYVQMSKGEKGQGIWCICKYPEKGQRKVENENLADTWNTVLKMAIKRSLVHATLNTTGASDTFTQDLEDLKGGIRDIGGDPTAHRVHEQEAHPSRTEASPEPRKQETAPTAHKEPERAPRGDPRDELPMEDIAKWETGSWQAQTVMSGGQLHHLGDLTLEQLIKIQNYYRGTTPSKWTPEQKKQVAAVELGIAALQAPAAAQEIIDKATVPPTGNPGGDSPADKIAKLRELCSEFVLTEAQWFEYAAKDELLKHIDQSKEPVTSFEDDRLDTSLDFLIETFAMRVLKWGFTKTAPVAEKKARKKKGELL